jgi:SpoVK/Ycf46/Vps4 family AAA+-type ATPase
MLQSLLRDSAIAAAKTYSHSAVEPRHLVFAAARHFRERPEVTPLFPKAKAALEPKGSALEVPKLNPEAEALLATFTSEKDVIAAVIKAFGGTPPPETAADTGTQQQATEQPAKAAVVNEPKPPETVAAVLEDLNNLIGLGSVKRQLASVMAVVQANQERVKAGKTQVTPGLHLVFTGPPGTGKTTVARLVARLYAAAGALPGANFTEASRVDLVAGYVGQTAIKTAEVVTKTRPGVLFIDEAYALTQDRGSTWDFGAEAIATLVKAMEDHRAEFAVIAAGYGDQMAEFIASNPGLKSRFKTFIEFPNYSAPELVQIFDGFAKANSVGLQDGVLDAAEKVFKKAVSQLDFGNARFARSLFEQAYARMASRAVADGTVTLDEVSTIQVADIDWEESKLERRERPTIGFNREE